MTPTSRRALAAMLIVAACLGASLARACTCPERPLLVRVNESTAVFLGRVMRVEESRERGYHGMLAAVKVLESFKAARPGDVVIIATGYGGGDCGVEFVTDSTFVVFARLLPRKSWLATSICDHTYRISGSSAELDSLRERTARRSPASGLPRAE